MSTRDPALGVLELASIARGLIAADALVKRAAVRMLRADPVTPGKLLLVFAGFEEEVLEAMAAAREVAGAEELDALVLPHAHPAIVPALDGVEVPPVSGALGILELTTVAATLLSCDRALKETDVSLVALHLARGIGGKGYLALCGEHADVEAALDAGERAVDPPRRVGRELIARPHPDLDWALGRLRER